MLGKSIIKKENGVDASQVTDAQIIKGMQLMGDVSTSTLKVTTTAKSIALIIPIILVFYTVFTFTL
jgi:hypothetical protein